MNCVLRSSIASLVLAATVSSFAQGSWQAECWDGQGDYYSTDYNLTGVSNDFIGLRMGISGTANWNVLSCFNPARTLDAVGRMCFFNGPVGSVQTPFDNRMALTTGAPFDPVGDFTYARIIIDKGPTDKTTELFGDGGLATIYVGSSRRYMVAVWQNADVQAELEARVIGDAVRMRWRLKNLSTTDAVKLGLKFGSYVGMRSNGDNQGFNQSNSLMRTNSGNARQSSDPVPYIGFTELPTVRPIRTMRNYIRSNPRFPDYVNFQWSQAQPYGLRIDMGPTEATADATDVNQILIGDYRSILFGNNMASRVPNDIGQGDPSVDDTFSDVREDSDLFIGEMAYINSFKAETVAPGGFRDVIHYIRSPWAVSEYLDPYSVVVDAPRIVESSTNGTNGLSPNPMTIAAYLDNQYADLDREVPLNNVRVKIEFPQGSGLSLASGESAEKTIATIAPNDIANVQWQVVADGDQVGYQPYTVTFSPTPGPTKVLQGKVLVSATPRVRLAEGANLVTIPWDFVDSSLDEIFGPVGDPNAIKLGRDYLAYQWDAGINSYQPVTTATRGSSIWIVPTSDLGYRSLNGAQLPGDQANGGITTTLQPGWNMVGNPYTIPVPLSQIIGVGDDDPSSTLTWSELVANGWVSGSLAYWQRSLDDPTSGSYLFTAGDTDLLLPQRGYWVYVSTLKPIRLSWPPLFVAGLSTSTRAKTEAWRQTEKQWRLELVARTSEGMDGSNYVGVAGSAADAAKLRIYEPPSAPNAPIELSIKEQVNGKPTRLAQSLADKLGKKTWTLVAKSRQAGEVTVNWPNINSIPRNVRVTMKDLATNTVRDLRFGSAYSFQMDQPGTREFEVTIEPAGVQRAVIGSVTVARPSRSPNAPLTISYTLSSDAVTSVRILGGSGKEVFTLQRGRSVSAGQNTATWNLRDNANRAVAPGAYQVEIVAETSNGERVRKVVPVNIVR